MAVLVLLLACVLLALLVRALLPSLRFIQHARRLTANVPGPPVFPLLGNMLEFVGPLEEIYDRMVDLVRRYGHTFKVWLGPYLVVITLEPEDVQVILTSPHLSDKPDVMYKGLEPILGRGLVTLNGAVYRRHRKAVTASMHLEILQEFVPTFNVHCGRLVSRLDGLAESRQVFDVGPLLGWCSSHTVCETVLSSDSAGMEAEVEAFGEMADKLGTIALYRVLRPWYDSNLLFALTSSKYPEYKNAIASVTACSTKVLSLKMDKLGATRGAAAADSRRRKTFLDMFLTSSESVALDRGELVDELKTLLTAGSSTSADFLSVFLVCMSLQPAVQRKVQSELDDIFGSQAVRDILLTDLSHMTYLECVLKETMRYFGPVPLLTRQATEDVPLPSGVVLPKDCFVTVLTPMVHRHPKHWPDPLAFDPERFTAERSTGRHPYSFIPFSAGPRNCIGQRYAMLFAKTLAASLLRRFDVLPDPEGPRSLPDVPLVGGITLTVRGGARIRVRRRLRSPPPQRE